MVILSVNYEAINKNLLLKNLKKRRGIITKRKVKPERDLEKAYPSKEFVRKLRRLADSIEQNKRFRIQISGERISVPIDAIFNIEHEREENNEEVEFQLKWVNPEK